MKTHTAPRRRWYVRSALVAATAFALTIAACVPSDRGVVTEDKQVFLENLLGEYVAGSGDKAARVTIAKGEGKAFAVTTTEPGQPAPRRAVLRVMKLGDHHFYDLETRNKEGGRPRFFFGRLTVDDKGVAGWTFPDGDAILADPALTTAEIPDDNDGAGKQRVVAMEPAKVQAFLLANGAKMTTETLRLTRAQPAAK